MRKAIVIIFASVTALTVAGASRSLPVRTAIAMMQSTDGFALYDNGSGLVYQETSPSPLAEQAKTYLSDAIKVVEKEQYRKFRNPVEIYATSTLDSLEKHCGWRRVLGCVVNNKVFLSPRILTQPKGTLLRLLTHELAHLHFSQQLGLFDQANIPVWFREGLAVYVGNKGARAKLESDKAMSAFKAGKSFYPNEQGSLVFPKYHTSFGLSRSVFYQQAASFVQFLSDNNKTGFQNLLLAVQDGDGFSQSFKRHYGVSLASKWKEFIASMGNSS